MANKSKQKGDREERQVVNRLRAIGVDCERTLESGARSDCSETWDIDVKGLRVECKLRKDGFKEIYKWIEGVDILTIRADRKPRLYVINQDLFEKLVRML